MLAEQDRRVLAFETRVWTTSTAKEDAILTELGWTPARYYQALNAVIDNPEALEAEPMLVKRLLNAREGRTGRRAHKHM